MAWTAPRDWTGGEFVTEAMMDTHIRDNFNVVPHVIFKTADESVASSTALQDDDHLSFAIGSNESWAFSYVLAWSLGSATASWSIAFNAPSGAAGWWGHVRDDAPDANLQTQISATYSDSQTGNGSQISISEVVQGRGYVLNGGTGGTFKLRWAQLSSNASASVLKKGSHLYIGRLT